MALGEEVFIKTEEFLPRVPPGRGFFLKKTFLPRVQHSGKRFFKKIKFFPKCCTRGRGFSKKKRMAPTVLTLPRALGRHSGKASPSVRILTLGEELFPVGGIPGGSSPSVALGEGFPECFCVFPECIWHLGKPTSPVVRAKSCQASWDKAPVG
jgi:hypothetical protein